MARRYSAVALLLEPNVSSCAVSCATAPASICSNGIAESALEAPLAICALPGRAPDNVLVHWFPRLETAALRIGKSAPALRKF